MDWIEEAAAYLSRASSYFHSTECPSTEAFFPSPSDSGRCEEDLCLSSSSCWVRRAYIKATPRIDDTNWGCNVTVVTKRAMSSQSERFCCGKRFPPASSYLLLGKTAPKLNPAATPFQPNISTKEANLKDVPGKMTKSQDEQSPSQTETTHALTSQAEIVKNTQQTESSPPGVNAKPAPVTSHESTLAGVPEAGSPGTTRRGTNIQMLSSRKIADQGLEEATPTAQLPRKENPTSPVSPGLPKNELDPAESRDDCGEACTVKGSISPEKVRDGAQCRYFIVLHGLAEKMIPLEAQGLGELTNTSWHPFEKHHSYSEDGDKRSWDNVLGVPGPVQANDFCYTLYYLLDYIDDDSSIEDSVRELIDIHDKWTLKRDKSTFIFHLLFRFYDYPELLGGINASLEGDSRIVEIRYSASSRKSKSLERQQARDESSANAAQQRHSKDKAKAFLIRTKERLVNGRMSFEWILLLVLQTAFVTNQHDYFQCLVRVAGFLAPWEELLEEFHQFLPPDCQVVLF
eukprot:scpid57138/ scgid2572/ 